MKEDHRIWHSPVLGRQMEMLVFGTGGYPMVVFPTSLGGFTQNKDFHLVDSIAEFIEKGKLKVYTPGGIDADSWYNESIHPAHRAANHVLYDRFVLEEVVVPALRETGFKKAAYSGCSFGAYHAMNFGLRHPGITGYVICMGGAFDIRNRVKGYYDDHVYFNNPPDFLPGLHDERLKEIGFIFGTGSRDMCMPANQQMAAMLHNKGIACYLDVVEGADHDWPVWREMFPRYVDMMLNAELAAVEGTSVY